MCRTINSRDRNHFCTIGIRHQNLKILVSIDTAEAEQIALSVIGNKQVLPRGTVRLKQLEANSCLSLGT